MRSYRYLDQEDRSLLVGVDGRRDHGMKHNETSVIIKGTSD